jgi:hypothetical protein
MDYEKLAQTYKPQTVKTLLIGEAPPPNGTSYFYKAPDKYPTRKSSIEDDTSLPATIFNHYFGRRPKDPQEYEQFLECLKEKGIFLIDIINEPLEIRKKDRSLNQDNINKLLSENNLKDLNQRIQSLTNKETQIIFLLARTKYLKVLKNKFQNVSFITWKCFRLDITESDECLKESYLNSVY